MQFTGIMITSNNIIKHLHKILATLCKTKSLYITDAK